MTRTPLALIAVAATLAVAACGTSSGGGGRGGAGRIPPMPQADRYSTTPNPHLVCVVQSKEKNKILYTNPYPRAAAMADGDGRAFNAYLMDKSYAKDGAYHCQSTPNERAAQQLLWNIKWNAENMNMYTLGVPWSPAR